MKRGTVNIPQSTLDAELVRLARLKLAAWKLLAELETASGLAKSAPSGSWRHDPLSWLNRPKS